MATNYFIAPKTSVETELNAMTLPAAIVSKMLSSFGDTVKVVNFNNADPASPLTAPTGDSVKGHDLVLIDPIDTVDLSGISAENIAGVDAFVFTTDENVNFTLSGSNTLSFKGVVTTNAGADIINLNSDVGVTVSSGYGNDSITVGSGNDYVIAGVGNDTINTGAGNDTVFTAEGNDYVNSGEGNDYINTGAGNDTVFAGAGNDTIVTGAGNDSISTGAGNDNVATGDGDDSVYVGSGNDSVNTGVGSDIVKLAAGFIGNAQFNGGTGVGSDTLDLRNVVITDVYETTGVAFQTGVTLMITLDDHSVIEATNFESFIYDSSTVDVDGGIVTVGVSQFVGHDFSV
jgi:Ca2+-binding RTX toxin-like protein